MAIKKPKGGIRAQSKTGAIGTSWLGRRWYELAKDEADNRLSRAKNYARNAHVLDLMFSNGVAQAWVQGSRRTPYAVEIQLDAFLESDWNEIFGEIKKNPLFVSRLLRNDYPEELEDKLEIGNLHLLPSCFEEFLFTCECPDDAIPCKHALAVYLLIGEAMDSDPYLLMEMRGMPREEFQAKLLGEEEASEMEPIQLVDPMPLPTESEAFWRSSFEELPPVAPANILRTGLALRLGNLPFWRGTTPFPEAIGEAYNQAALHCTQALENCKRELAKLEAEPE